MLLIIIVRLTILSVYGEGKTQNDTQRSDTQVGEG
jgi:hypothetical protein